MTKPDILSQLAAFVSDEYVFVASVSRCRSEYLNKENRGLSPAPRLECGQAFGVLGRWGLVVLDTTVRV